MTLYNINMGIGWASSGVEYAQAYRAKLLRQIGKKAKFIFTDLILSENIQHLTTNLGFEDDEVIWMYHYFTNVKLAPTSYTLDDVIASIDFPVEKVERNGKIVRYFYDQGNQFATCYLTDINKELVDRTEFVAKGNLIRKDYYNYTRYCSEYYTPKDNKAYLYQRRFFNEDGGTAFDEIVDNGQSLFRFEKMIFYSRKELLSYFIKKLNFQKGDIVIIDRSSEICQPLFEEKGSAVIGIVVHAEHYSENATDNDAILWNNYYEYVFSHAKDVDFFICSTDVQSQTLSDQFVKYQQISPLIITIPVGSLDSLKYPDSPRKPFSLMTASRLANEKHVDWLILAVIEARKVLSELSFDIYGVGAEETKLRDLITQNNADNFISLKGHVDLSDVYKNYQAYLSASTSEGFGLSLLEAAGSGLPIIGFDVPYGNINFVRNFQNGILISRETDNCLDKTVYQYASSIISMFQEYNIHDWQNISYEIAEDYLDKQVEIKWKLLLERFEND